MPVRRLAFVFTTLTLFVGFHLAFQREHLVYADVYSPPLTRNTQEVPDAPPIGTESPIGAILQTRPYPPIVARVIAPTPRRPLVTPRAGTIPPVQWEEPSGPAANWQNTENYLILGTDQRQGTGGNWRTDVIMIVGLDRAAGKAVVFSIPRDLYVNIPGYGMGRINQADFIGEQNAEHYGGGPQLVSTILSQTLGIATEHWVRIRMDGFVRLVDAIGGVTVQLDCPFAEPIFNLTTNSWDYFTLPAGENWMDGETAYWFVRLRLRSSDIARAERQRQFLWALRDQMLSTNLITRFPELWSAFSESFTTDLSLFEFIDLTGTGLSYGAENVRAGGLSLADLQGFTTEQGAAVLGIANPGRVRAVVNGVWEAQPMANTNRRAPEQCPPIPTDATQINNVLNGLYATDATVPEPTMPVTTTDGTAP